MFIFQLLITELKHKHIVLQKNKNMAPKFSSYKYLVLLQNSEIVQRYYTPKSNALNRALFFLMRDRRISRGTVP